MSCIDLMHKHFGTVDARCEECGNFISVMPTMRKRFKCTVYGVTSSSSSDWRKSYKACGMFNKEVDSDFKPVIRWKRENEADSISVADGQVSVFESIGVD